MRITAVFGSEDAAEADMPIIIRNGFLSCISVYEPIGGAAVERAGKSCPAELFQITAYTP